MSVWGVRNRNRYLKKVPTLLGLGLSGACLVGGHDSQKPQRREHVSDAPSGKDSEDSRERRGRKGRFVLFTGS